MEVNNNMYCDLCKKHFQEVIILRKDRFNGSTSERFRNQIKRVCWDCAIILVRLNKYSFGEYWDRQLTHDILIRGRGIR